MLVRCYKSMPEQRLLFEPHDAGSRDPQTVRTSHMYECLNTGCIAKQVTYRTVCAILSVGDDLLYVFESNPIQITAEE